MSLVGLFIGRRGQALSPKVKPSAVTSSQSTPVTPDMYSSGDTPRTTVRPPSTSPTMPSQRGTARDRAATKMARPARPTRVHSHGMVPIQWLYIAADESANPGSSSGPGIMNSVSRPEPRIETTAVPARPTRATTGAMLSGNAVRSRRNSPAAKTIIEHGAERGDRVEGEQHRALVR